MNNKEQIIDEFEKIIMEKLKELETMENEDKRADRLNVLYNLHKILNNYDKLEPILRDFFKKEAQKKKFNTDQSWDSITK